MKKEEEGNINEGIVSEINPMKLIIQ